MMIDGPDDDWPELVVIASLQNVEVKIAGFRKVLHVFDVDIKVACQLTQREVVGIGHEQAKPLESTPTQAVPETDDEAADAVKFYGVGRETIDLGQK
jgi:hypothetical protein